VGNDKAVFDVPRLGPFTGTAAGVLWKSFETYSQFSFRNRCLVASDWWVSCVKVVADVSCWWAHASGGEAIDVVSGAGSLSTRWAAVYKKGALYTFAAVLCICGSCIAITQSRMGHHWSIDRKEACRLDALQNIDMPFKLNRHLQDPHKTLRSRYQPCVVLHGSLIKHISSWAYGGCEKFVAIDWTTNTMAYCTAGGGMLDLTWWVDNFGLRRSQ
jgi:hypothetical protein